MTWLFESTLVENLPEDCVGFVYEITNNISGRKYIGKKLAKFAKTTYKTVKLKNGNKKRKRIKSKIDSDWQTYYGSNDELKKDVEQLGAENFTRRILFYCRTKAECSYISVVNGSRRLNSCALYLDPGSQGWKTLRYWSAQPLPARMKTANAAVWLFE